MNVFTAKGFSGQAALASLLEAFPVALLTKEGD